MELLNIADAGAQLSFSLRDSSGNLLEMPFYNAGCPSCPAILRSSHSITLQGKAAARLHIVRQNPAKVGWAEFSFEPEAAVAVSAQLWVTAADGTTSFGGIPPTSAYRKAFLYLDNTSDFDTTLVFVNLSATSRQGLALHFRAADDRSVECEANADLAPLGQAVLNAFESLPCSVGKLGLLGIQGQHDFTGIALVDNWEHDGMFTRQFVQALPSENRFATGDTIPNMPRGFWVPSLVSGAGYAFPGGKVTLTWRSSEGAIEYETFRWTCASDGGCEVVSGKVTKGTIIESATADGPAADERPSFGPARVSSQSYTVGAAISALTLPIASGGDGTLTYSLVPTVPGLSFSPSSRRLAGTPTAFGSHSMVYTVQDVDGDTDTIRFSITVQESRGENGSESPQGSQNAGQYTPLEGWTVSSGRVQFLFASAGRCVNLSGSSINGVTYTIHESKWQRRSDVSSAWADIPGTKHTGGVCSYTPTEPGEYRGVAEISIGGERGRHSTKNILTHP